jgi:hypothetical protein
MVATVFTHTLEHNQFFAALTLTQAGNITLSTQKCLNYLDYLKKQPSTTRQMPATDPDNFLSTIPTLELICGCTAMFLIFGTNNPSDVAKAAATTVYATLAVLWGGDKIRTYIAQKNQESLIPLIIFLEKLSV